MVGTEANRYEYQEGILLDKEANTRKVYHIKHQKMGRF